jgi:hypothetical protein
MRTFVLMAMLCLTASLYQPVSAQVVIDFSAGTLGDLGTNVFTDAGTGLTATGYYLNLGAWSPANLYRRNVPNDHGFGVCNPLQTPCPGPSGGGDINELDNRAGVTELIVLQLPAGYKWVSIQISSMDTNGEIGDPEMGKLYADNNGVFGAPGSVGDTPLKDFTGGVDAVEATFNIPVLSTSAPYLVFEPYDHVNGTNLNNDYLVYKATIIAVEGGEGCTPGFWKQPHHLDSWVVYTPDQYYDDVFGVTSSFGPTFTLLDALEQGGGKEKALGRHAVAALLNAASGDVSYAFTTAEVIDIVQGAYVTGAFNVAKNLLQDENESGCPLN